MASDRLGLPLQVTENPEARSLGTRGVMPSNGPRSFSFPPPPPTAQAQPAGRSRNLTSTTDNGLSIGIGVGVGLVIVLILGAFAYAVYLRRRYTCSLIYPGNWRNGEDCVKDSRDGGPQQTSSSSQDPARQATPSLAEPHTGLKYVDETQAKRVDIENSNPNDLRTHTQNTPVQDHTYSNLSNLFPKPCEENEAIYMNVTRAEFFNIPPSEAGGTERTPAGSPVAVDKKKKKKKEGHSGASVNPAVKRIDSVHIYEELPAYGPFLASDAWDGHR
ncbi:uncharacterized protein [Panulirus ornatus]|uniref:uncharacterized protein n=1 Tax=Panulirus ornatus TaxID=150431 RepID=UPI003A8595CE